MDQRILYRMEAHVPMKLKILLSLLAIALLATPTWAQQDPNDAGAQDSIYFLMTHQPDVTSGDSSLILDLYIFNDAQNVVTAGGGFEWDHEGITMDSAKFTDSALAAFNGFQFVYFKNVLDSTNFYKRFQFGGTRTAGDGLLASATATRVCTYWFTVDSLETTEAINVDSLKFSGSTQFQFVSADFTIWFPLWDGTVVLQDMSDVTNINPGALPEEYGLAQNYPNPFNPSTNIDFDVPVNAHVTLSVYNVLGQRVTTLVDEQMAPGSYQKVWNGTNDGGSQVASGIYFYRLEADNQVVDTKKMMMLK
ncbi:T9SS type A sorting domain-containing protein [candidate division GN15 bacterium]|nr:T9SS type A sorting domain-containing protein [candidate division GN15 bacterium]